MELGQGMHSYGVAGRCLVAIEAIAVVVPVAQSRTQSSAEADVQKPHSSRDATRSPRPSEIKRNLTALLVSGAQRPALRSDEQWLNTESALLQQLGTLRTRPAIRVLVELAAFDLGTSASEELRCYLLEASKGTKKVVLDELRRATNTCVARFQKNGICKPEAAWREDLDLLRAAVERGDVCSVD